MPDEVKPQDPPPPPTDPKRDEVAELSKALEEARGALKKGELQGMSESTAHALLETIKELTAEIRTLKGAPRDEAASAGRTKRWFPF